MANGSGQLDGEELMHLALKAMKEDRDEDAITCLKRALILEPESGVLHHLLGATYAQIGMIDRAIEEMTEAVQLAPELTMCRFQLGLLHFTSGSVPTAEEVWAPLAELPPEAPLALFRSGLLHLAVDEFAPCIADLRRGVELNTEHPSLNRDMGLVIDMAAAALREGDAATTEPAPVDYGRHVLLSGYHELSDDKK